MPLTSIQLKTYENDIVLLNSVRDRSNGGSIRLSNYDRNAISHAIDVIEEKVRDNGGE